jgi:trehalose/maltose hydrolase-like predicted phosphorylase
MIDGFLGFRPTAHGCRIGPNPPKDWPELTVNRIHLHDLVLQVKVTPSSITVTKEGTAAGPCRIEVPSGAWQVRYLDAKGAVLATKDIRSPDAEAGIEVDWSAAGAVIFIKG